MNAELRDCVAKIVVAGIVGETAEAGAGARSITDLGQSAISFVGDAGHPDHRARARPVRIRVNTLVPGLIATDPYGSPASLERRHATVPMGRGGVAHDMTGPALFLVSDDSAYVTGGRLVVDGGALVQQRSPQVDTQRPEDYPSVDSI
ncbi:MAG: SDR family oxidoreductase [Aeromicrobium sp.]